MSLCDRDTAEEIVLDAAHTGETYNQPERAIDLAFKAFCERRREEEAEFFEYFRAEMVRDIRSYWARMAREAKR
jgi:hypothetical protein